MRLKMLRLPSKSSWALKPINSARSFSCLKAIFENSSWPTPASVSRLCRPYFIPSPMPNFRPWPKNAMTSWKAAMNRWPAIGNNVCLISALTMKKSFRSESRNFGIRKLPCPKSGTKPKGSAVPGRKNFRQPRPWKPTGNCGNRRGRKWQNLKGRQSCLRTSGSESMSFGRPRS